MRKVLASTFVLALFAMAFAEPPIDYELYCSEGGDLIGVLSLTEGGVHVALVEGASCAEGDIVVVGPDDASVVLVEVDDWDAEPLEVKVTIGHGDDAVGSDVVNLVLIPQVAIDGMLNAQRLRAAAMELRAETEARREAAREGRVGDGEEGNGMFGESGDREPAGPPADVPRGVGPGGRP